MASHRGDVKVTEEGVLTYVFPELMISAGGPVTEREPDPAWRRLEYPESVTGNDRKTDLVVGGINGFNLTAAASAPMFIFPRLGLEGDLAWIGLVWVPLAFSTLFFAVPLLRSIVVRFRNRRRVGRNLRKVILGQVFQAALGGGGPKPVSLDRAKRHLHAALPPSGGNGLVEPALLALVAEFDGDVTETPDGNVEFEFPEIRRQFEGAERMRRTLALGEQAVGEIVYATDDSADEAHERDLASFDRELDRHRSLERYVQAPDRIAFVDDFELVAFDEELRITA
jgi:hypothetical protein